jgi:hypothetical protein
MSADPIFGRAWGDGEENDDDDSTDPRDRSTASEDAEISSRTDEEDDGERSRRIGDDEDAHRPEEDGEEAGGEKERVDKGMVEDEEEERPDDRMVEDEGREKEDRLYDDTADEDGTSPDGERDEDEFLGDVTTMKTLKVESPEEAVTLMDLLRRSMQDSCALLFRRDCAACRRFWPVWRAASDDESVDVVWLHVDCTTEGARRRAKELYPPHPEGDPLTFPAVVRGQIVYQHHVHPDTSNMDAALVHQFATGRLSADVDDDDLESAADTKSATTFDEIESVGSAEESDRRSSDDDARDEEEDPDATPRDHHRMATTLPPQHLRSKRFPGACCTLFYWHDCGHCNTFAPEWNAAVDRCATHPSMAPPLLHWCAVDVLKEKELFESHGGGGVPRVILLNASGDTAMMRAREQDALLEEVAAELGGSPHPSSDEEDEEEEPSSACEKPAHEATATKYLDDGDHSPEFSSDEEDFEERELSTDDEGDVRVELDHNSVARTLNPDRIRAAPFGACCTLFYWKDCLHCRDMAASWNDAVARASRTPALSPPTLHWCGVDIEREARLFDAFGGGRVPRVVVIEASGESSEYAGERTMDGLLHLATHAARTPLYRSSLRQTRPPTPPGTVITGTLQREDAAAPRPV